MENQKKKFAFTLPPQQMPGQLYPKASEYLPPALFVLNAPLQLGAGYAIWKS